MRKALGTIVTLATRILASVFAAASWRTWLVLLKATFALSLTDRELETFTRLTNRTRPPATPVREAWFIIGRRAGKSMIAALIVVFLTC
jgi:hypothetical protein